MEKQVFMTYKEGQAMLKENPELRKAFNKLKGKTITDDIDEGIIIGFTDEALLGRISKTEREYAGYLAKDLHPEVEYVIASERKRILSGDHLRDKYTTFNVGDTHELTEQTK